MLRVFYTAGPGNAFDIFRRWKNGERDLTTSHVPYSGQMLEACARHGAAALITCTHESGEDQACGNISISRRPDLSHGQSGLAYHRSLYDKARQNMRDAIDFGANIAVISDGENPSHYAPLHRRGVRIVQALHCRLWAENRPPSFMQRLRLRGYGKAYASGGITVLSSSDVVSRQVAMAARGKLPTILEFLPLYYPEHYGGLSPRMPERERLEILFIGRVEENKGALDLIEIGSLLRDRGIGFRFQICGAGTALDRMKQAVTDRGLVEQFLFHGWCDRNQLRKVMTDCDVSIVPTRSDFTEGFNQVVVETILAGCPPIASAICPAVKYVGDAAVVVRADDIVGYADALENLARSPEKIARHIQACSGAGRRFLDPSFSFGQALDDVFLACLENRAVNPRGIDPTDI